MRMTCLFRVDAGVNMGLGHAMRCLALAQAWQDRGGEAAFAMAQTPPALGSRVLSEGMEVIHLDASPGSALDARRTGALARERRAAWVVVDGYQFGSEYQRWLKEFQLSVLFIDDYGHAPHYWADFVINQNPHAHAGLYANREAYTSLLLGTRYTLLRREFGPWRQWRREIPPMARKILVTLGGSDPDNVTGKVVQALREMEPNSLEAVVLAGGANPHLGELQARVGQMPFPVRLENSVANMPELIAWADVGITAGGGTCWETAFLGLPCLVVVLAENQAPVAEKLQELQVALNLGWHAQLSPGAIAGQLSRLLTSEARRQEMSAAGQRLVDGEGVDRVLMHLRGEPVRLRPVRETDCRLLWEWVNDPEVRAASFSRHHISWEEHHNWFHQKLGDPNCLHFIFLDGNDQPVGQVRFDIQPHGEAEIDINIDRKVRGSGWGKIILNEAVTNIFNKTDIHTVNAFIKPENLKSIKAFEKAGFKMGPAVKARGNDCIHYIRSKER